MEAHSLLRSETPQLPVLLAFTPSAQCTDVDGLLEKARSVLNPSVQIMHISETTHPEVVRSFGFTSLPGFVLLQRGLELWRYSGPVDSPELLALLSSQTAQTIANL